MEPIAADEMVIEYVGQNIRQVRPPPPNPQPPALAGTAHPCVRTLWPTTACVCVCVM